MTIIVLRLKFTFMSHLTREQRYTIASILQNGYNQKEIALVIKKDKSVVSREIRRNADARSGVYRDDLAHRKYLKRQEYKAKPRTFTPEVEEYVRDRLRSEERRVGKSVDLGGRRIIKKSFFSSRRRHTRYCGL